MAGCFDTATLVPGAGCSGSIPRTSTSYDEGIVGLAATYWANTTLSGAPALHKTGVGDSTGALNRDWGSSTPDTSVLPTSGWSAMFNGDLNVLTAGSYTFRLESDDGARLFIDDTLVADNWGSSLGYTTGTVSNLTAGQHRIRVDFADDADATAYLRLKWGASPVLVPGSQLSPAYGLVTRTKTHDSTTGSPSQETTTAYGVPELGLATAVTVDPAGLALATTVGYESDTSGYYRRLTRTLPAGNTTTSSYYGAAETADNPCTPTVEAISQAGLLKQDTGPDPDGAGPQTGLIEEYRYDARARMVASRIGAGGWTCVSYDTRGRVAATTVPAFGAEPARTATYSYAVSNNPLVTSVTDPAGTITTQTDRLGRVTSYTDVWANTTASSYDQAGRLTQTTGPAGTITYTYNTAGRLTGQKIDNLTVAVPTYHTTSGELTSVSYPTGTGNGGNGTVLTVGRDNAGRLTTLEWRTAGGVLIASDQVTRSQAGRVVNQLFDGVDPDPAANNYSYDGAGRLISAKVPGHTISYGFAGSGGCGTSTAAGRNSNRTSITDNAATYTYCYDQADRLTSTTDPAVGAIAYDNHANTTSMGGISFGYDGVDLHVTSQTGTAAPVRYGRDATGRIISHTSTSASGGSFRAAATNQSKTGTLTITKPAGTVSGDVLVAQITTNSSRTTTPPSGWTLLDQRSSGNVRAGVWYRVASSSEPATYSFTITGNGQAAGGIAAYSGIDPNTPIDAWAESAGTATTTHQAPSATATTPNGLLVTLVGLTGGTSVTPATGMTERWERAATNNPSSSRVTTQAADQPLTAAGASGTRTITSSVSADSVRHTLILKPAVVTTTLRYGHTGAGDSATLIQTSAGATIGRTFPLPGGVVSAKNSSGDRWTAANTHGDVMAVTTSTGTKLGSSFTYDPYGQPLAGHPDIVSGSLDYGWTGQHLRPTETGSTLGYAEMGVRVYVPRLGRFLQTDPIEGGSANPYDYCHADPLNCWDLTGEWGWRDLGRALVNVAIAAGAAAAAVACGATVVCAVGVAVGAAVVGTAAHQAYGHLVGSPRPLMHDAIDAAGSAGFGAACAVTLGAGCARVLLRPFGRHLAGPGRHVATGSQLRRVTAQAAGLLWFGTKAPSLVARYAVGRWAY